MRRTSPSASKLKIPGLSSRQGAASVIDTHVGREYVLAEAHEEIVSDSYRRARPRRRLRPIESPEMDELALIEPGPDYTYNAEVVAAAGAHARSTTDDFSVTVPAQGGDRRPRSMRRSSHTRERFATLEPVEDRGVETNDFAAHLLRRYRRRRGLRGQHRRQVPLRDGPRHDAGRVRRRAPRRDARRARSLEFEIPDTCSNEEFVGKTAEFDITVHEIKTKMLPEVDDEFALSVGGFESVEDMRDAAQAALDRQAETNHMRGQERALRELLASRLEGDVPAGDDRRPCETRCCATSW